MKPPIIILHHTQLGENIGMCARAMLNCGFQRLRLVAPRKGWPDESARATAADADQVLEAAECFDTLAAATADCHRLYAATARPRAVQTPFVPASEVIGNIRAASKNGEDSQTAILFGPEASWLENDALPSSNALFYFPINPDFNSLNLAQAVLLFGWEWLRTSTPPSDQPNPPAREPLPAAPAAKHEIHSFLDRLEAELEHRGFFLTPDQRPDTSRKLRTLFTRTCPSDQELRMLHGVITALVKDR